MSCQPKCGEHQILSKCVPECPKTCENKDLLHACKPECGALPQCICEMHYVLDTKKNKCVLPSECPKWEKII